ncbi:hypothetical protein GO988_15725 [Hymenobacter sp. HMF4947]|uniref:histidine kinase n=1 Tax=Hymenobacter ginkgonis TaxID=2682976 RepID=A0A7K1TH79_9BACT|nr:ATP-binding protein [Hymenobacter ginkgonis]MVN77780.1 hypothetical protein [Hymenobacter ginkgonis]
MPTLLPLTPEALCAVQVFCDLPADVLTWLQQAGELRRYAPGEVVVAADSPADSLVAVLRGSVRFGDGPGPGNYRLEAGELGGALPYSRAERFAHQGVAEVETEAYVLACGRFIELERLSPVLTQRLIGLMNDRTRAEVRAQEHGERLRALGKLAAGLSHELNNPAAAVSRGAANLTQLLQIIPLGLLALVATSPPAAALATVTDLARRPLLPVALLPALEAADREAELADWLETQGCPDGYEHAAGLREAGLHVADLAPVAAALPAGSRPAAFAWLSGHLLAARLAADISEASRRISALVADVKTYTHLDRAPTAAPLVVTEGLDSTLHLFDHALRTKNVRLTRAYASGLPQVLGQAGSLNQVWTNLLDNALDALPAAEGTLAVEVTAEANQVRVSITDNGPGIPPEVLPHLFEPFFTTKPPGEGTGQGLDIARRIVREHGGRLEVTFEPGCTVFTAWLPALRPISS